MGGNKRNPIQGRERQRETSNPIKGAGRDHARGGARETNNKGISEIPRLDDGHDEKKSRFLFVASQCIAKVNKTNGEMKDKRGGMRGGQNRHPLTSSHCAAQAVAYDGSRAIRR